MKPTMNKKDLIDALAEANGLTKAQNKSFVDDLMRVAHDQLETRGTFAIYDLVRLDVEERKARDMKIMGKVHHIPQKLVIKARTLGKARRPVEKA